jgi:phospholipid/cholesterol/gamma-HCH transport system substrate-binding protein
MITRSQKIRLGVFVAFAILAAFVTAVVIVAPKFIQKKDTYFIGYRDISVTGLQEGGPVKYHGLTVGNVERIFMDPADVRSVIVEVSLDHGTTIKEDTYADITALGITGLMLVELRGGSNEAATLKPGASITPGKSFTEMITGQAEIIAEKVEIVLNNLIDLTNPENRSRLIQLIDNSNRVMASVQGLLRANSENLTATLENVKQASEQLRELSFTTLRTMKSLERVTRSDSLTQIVNNIAEITNSLKKNRLNELLAEFSTALQSLNRLLAAMDADAGTRSDFIRSLKTLEETADYLNEFSRLLAEDPSVLVRGARPGNPPDDQLGD